MNGAVKRVLYVEDDACMRDVTVMTLEMMPDLEICACASGEEALSKIQEFAPDLLLLDMGLPDMSGLELLTKLRGKNVPAVFITGEEQPVSDDHWPELGIVGWIRKPYQPSAFLARLEQICSEFVV